jgi:CheY-like chemotaxis protein
MTADTQVAILVVDDEPEVRATAADIFMGLGFSVLEADDGTSALKLLSAHPEIAILFTDVRMPGMSGIELAEEAQRIRPDLRVVLTSGYIGEAALPKHPFLRKPWRLHDLETVLPIRRDGAARQSAD